MANYRKSTPIPVPAKQLYNWHARPGAFDRLAPPWDNIETLEAQGGIEDGAIRIMKLRQGPLSLLWEAHHHGHIPGRQFIDEQVRGPFKRWVHTHRFESISDHSSQLVDKIDFALPLAPLSHRVGMSQALNKLDPMFAFRHRRTYEDLLRHHTHTARPLKIAISGASGLIGTALKAFLTTGGHDVRCLVRDRHQLGPSDIFWSPDTQEIEQEKLEGLDAVIHLAGEPVAQRWDERTKTAIRDSRVRGTKLLSDAISRLDVAPSVFISASGIGYYGHTSSSPVDESSPPGDTFLADVCQSWEAATSGAVDAGIRTIQLRIGVVLDPKGGALPSFQRALKWGFASRFGTGDQPIGWIDMDDLLGAILFIIDSPTIEGPVNATAPNPVTNRELLQTLATLQSRPSFLPVPSSILRGVLGHQASEEIVLRGQRAMPTKLQRANFPFFYPSLESSLRAKLGLHDEFIPTMSEASPLTAADREVNYHE